jgi:diadenylate cyclase
MGITAIQSEILRAAVAMAAKKDFDHLLYIGDLPLPEDIVKAKSMARRKLVQAVTSEVQRQIIDAMDVTTLALPVYDIARQERFKIALVGGVSKGLFQNGDVVMGVVGRNAASFPDTIMVVTIGGDSEESVDTGFGVVGNERIPSAIFESVMDLAVDIARDGWEGHPLGTLLVVGDTAAVLEKSKQLTLNPFQGYSEEEKNILNPDVRDAIKNFAVLDGAFVIREDGVVLAAGRYLNFDEGDELSIPLGLGARHMAAAGISQDTEALALVISETSGVVRIFQSGRCVLEIHGEQRARHNVPELAAPTRAKRNVRAPTIDVSAVEAGRADGDAVQGELLTRLIEPPAAAVKPKETPKGKAKDLAKNKTKEAPKPKGKESAKKQPKESAKPKGK